MRIFSSSNIEDVKLSLIKAKVNKKYACILAIQSDDASEIISTLNNLSFKLWERSR